MENIQEILKKFRIDVEAKNYGNGHINDTYIADCKPKYIVQRININVFKDPEAVMRNIELVTKHLGEKISQNGGDPKRETLTVISTEDNKPFYKSESGNYYRAYLYIDNAVSYDIVTDNKQLYYAGREFGKFQKMLSDFPAEQLTETIPNFHNTEIRFNNLLKAIEENKSGRADNVKEEIEFALKRQSDVVKVVNGITENKIPLRVTHNDTKLNNVLLDSKTGEGVCVIDLDTVMPGSMLYDYGDALRFGASSGAEDEKDLSKIWFDKEKFIEFSKGYIEELGSAMTETEKELLVFSAKLMTFECGMRFLTDYIDGDTYFKTHYDDHNLVRCRTQFKLVADIESKYEELNEEIKKLF